ncbi:Uncharacterised protein [Mycobacteroides abscessus subsp. abscessus]|uniref:hypothetical protein n=3 Tax=Mycobacteroides abscessus TaxID=36809 RepID=UPI0005DB4DA3|nr:hypothetical protein [Mycobacteroides abscessus]MDO3014866.1 hypothetical protein [Mycobacteroides abscessus subsp. abscessus]MDO3316738.1 hypothetical protein [Mycobacteroides abscessus subsp. abscessus]MDO3346482.1 hypothetical protein [Mycobacteroides abscessus subsp. abscessus]CPT76750.1 Uncharacterised protein [Mycobacteroides abscessus]CPT77756.1 Uncharacterised protein [Mycobacteroides abscessus]
MDDRFWEQQLLAADERAEEDGREIRSERRARFWGFWVALAFGVFGVAQLGVVFGSASGTAPAPVPLSGEFFTRVYYAVQGRLIPDTAMTIAVTSLSLCGAINAALFLEGLVASRRAQIAMGEARRYLELGAQLLAMGAVAAAGACWASLDSPHAVGTAAGATLFAVVAALLATTAGRQVQAAERANAFGQTVRKLMKLDTWEAALKDRTVPRPLAGVSVPNRKPLWRRYWVGAAIRLALLAMIPMLYLLVMQTGAAAIGLIRHHHTEWDWSALGAGLGAAAYVGATTGLGLGYLTLHRYAEKYATDRIRLHLDIRPPLAIVGYFLVASAVLALTGIHGGLVWALYLAGWLLPVPAVCWVAFTLSRLHPHIQWSRWAAAPVWGMVELSLRARREKLERHRARLLSEEQAEAA